MIIEYADIQNFRKLKATRLAFSREQTILVGPNNSGKTSAMDVLSFFLDDKKKLPTRDFTLSNWISINEISVQWLNDEENDQVDQNEEYWKEQNSIFQKQLPQLDIWLNVSEKEVHHVHNLIPTLDWDGGRLGIKLLFEPSDIATLFEEFKDAFKASSTLSEKHRGKLKIWPNDLWSFLDRKSNLNKFFIISTYILDPAEFKEEESKNPIFQDIPTGSIPIGKEALGKLIKVNSINAQRGFVDANSSKNRLKPLSLQLREYYTNHLSPEEKPTEDDLDALDSIDSATKSFDERLRISFKPALKELEDINYPGFGNPSIKIESSLSPIDGINHESAVHFKMKDTDDEDPINKLSLPEYSNGLGYQNLISIVFELIRFRDEWMKIGKKRSKEEDSFEPLHLVLIEEPEAHLHAQVQQVFINKAYSILRNHDNLKENKRFQTQLVVSTHSNHIAHEVDFNSLRYFKRIIPKEKGLAYSTIINLSNVFGLENLTTKFVTRYLRTTHCDVFFADVVILVEGSAEKMLIPHFISGNHPNLSNAYLSIIEIDGSHAHKLKPLIESLGVLTLIITDLDPIDPAQNRSSVFPEKDKGYETGNSTITKWLPGVKKLDNLLDIPFHEKETNDGSIRIAFQVAQNIEDSSTSEKLHTIATSFEDSLIYSNLDLFRSLKGFGLIKKFKEAANSKNLKEIVEKTYEILRSSKSGSKAKFALDILFQTDPNQINPPPYIKEGLNWVEKKLQKTPIG